MRRCIPRSWILENANLTVVSFTTVITHIIRTTRTTRTIPTLRTATRRTATLRTATRRIATRRTRSLLLLRLFKVSGSIESSGAATTTPHITTTRTTRTTRTIRTIPIRRTATRRTAIPL